MDGPLCLVFTKVGGSDADEDEENVATLFSQAPECRDPHRRSLGRGRSQSELCRCDRTSGFAFVRRGSNNGSADLTASAAAKDLFVTASCCRQTKIQPFRRLV